MSAEEDEPWLRISNAPYFRLNSEITNEKKGGYLEGEGLYLGKYAKDATRVDLFMGSQRYPLLHSNLLSLSFANYKSGGVYLSADDWRVSWTKRLVHNELFKYGK